MKGFLLFICIFVVFSRSFAQDEYGQNPNDIDWKYLRSPAANIIFASGLETEVQRIANLINYQAEVVKPNLGPARKKVNIVVQDQTVIANGYVTVAPFRSEFYATPPPDFNFVGSMNWLDLLTIHEYRHVQQLINMRRGFSRFLSFLFGEYGWGGGSVFSIPDWFFEGDAVWAETNFTASGRGRIPTFTDRQRAIALSGTGYSYMKWRNGSFRDVVPNHYELGYTMISHVRNTRGVGVMEPVIHDAAAYRPVFYPFSQALKRHAGYTTTDLFRSSWAHAKDQWAQVVDTLDLTAAKRVTQPDPKKPAFYQFPQVTDKGELVALRTTYATTDEIVRIGQDGSEWVVAAPGRNEETNFHYANGTYVWTEFRQDPRWSNRNFSDIVMVSDPGDGKVRLTRKGKYFSPVLMSDASTVVAYHYTPAAGGSIRRVNTTTKEMSTVVQLRKGETAGRLSLTADDRSVVSTLKSDNRLAIWKIDITTGERLQITPWTTHVIDAVRVFEGYVYYSASFSGIENIYRSPLDGSQRIEQVTSVAVGAGQPGIAPDGQTLYFVEPTADGDMISAMQLSPDQSFPAYRITAPMEMNFQDQTPSENILGQVPETKYPVETYGKSPFHGFRFHSWLISPFPSSTGIEVIGDNYLRDFTGTLVAGVNRNEESPYYGARMSFYHWYPVLSFSSSFMSRESDYIDPDLDPVHRQFYETSVAGEVQVPLQWILGNYYAWFTPSGGLEYHMIGAEEPADDITTPYSFTSASTGASFRITRRTARQNIRPRWGVSTTFNYTNGITRDEIGKTEFSSSIFLPGLGRNHGWRLTGSYQREPATNRFQLQDTFFYPRGFDILVNDEFVKWSAEYAFPLWYPDWGFWGIAYFKRLRTNLFYDHGVGKLELEDTRTSIYRSTGAELIMDSQLFNLIPVSLGVRASRLLNSGPLNSAGSVTWEFLVTTDLL